MAEQWERLPELFSYMEKCRDEGMSEEDLATHLHEINQFEWDSMVEKALAEGTTQEQIDAWVAALEEDRMRFADDDPEDAVDSDDPGYVPDPEEPQV